MQCTRPGWFQVGEDARNPATGAADRHTSSSGKNRCVHKHALRHTRHSRRVDGRRGGRAWLLRHASHAAIQRNTRCRCIPAACADRRLCPDVYCRSRDRYRSNARSKCHSISRGVFGSCLAILPGCRRRVSSRTSMEQRHVSWRRTYSDQRVDLGAHADGCWQNDVPRGVCHSWCRGHRRCDGAICPCLSCGILQHDRCERLWPCTHALQLPATALPIGPLSIRWSSRCPSSLSASPRSFLFPTAQHNVGSTH